MTIIKKLLMASFAGLLAIGLSACGNEEADSSTSNSKTSSNSSSRTDRPNGISEHDAAAVIKSATSAEKVEFKNGAIRVHFKEGSKEQPTAGIYCTAVEVVAIKGEKRFMVYPDGELDCDKRYE